jgi:AraC-like DNA-binding protein
MRFPKGTSGAGYRRAGFCLERDGPRLWLSADKAWLSGFAESMRESLPVTGDYVRFHRFPLTGIDPMTAATGRSFPRHTHDQYGIGLVDSGGHASWSGLGQVEAGPGSFICVNPGEVHDGRAVGHRGRSWRILYFEPARMQHAYADVYDRAHETFTFEAPVFTDERMRRLFNRAFEYATATKQRGCEMASETAILELVARLGTHSTARRKRDESSTPGIQRARNRIDDDPTVPLTLVELARETGLSRYQLIRGFARELNLTPHAYIVQRRIALARRLIRAGHPLVEVAGTTGFCDQSHLTRCFVRQFGITPWRYARRAE